MEEEVGKVESSFSTNDHFVSELLPKFPSRILRISFRLRVLPFTYGFIWG